LKRRTPTARFGPATPVADNTAVNGVSDRSQNRFRITNPKVRKPPVCELVQNNEANGEWFMRPTAIRRSSSLPPTEKMNGGVEGEVTLTSW